MIKGISSDSSMKCDNCLLVLVVVSIGDKNFCQKCTDEYVKKEFGWIKGNVVIKPGGEIRGGNYIDYNTTKKDKIKKKLKRTDLSDKKRKKLEKKLKKLN